MVVVAGNPKSAIPVIDISAYFGGDIEEKRAIASKIGAAARDLGFFVVGGHNISTDLIARMHAACRAFYDLGDEQKAVYAPPNSEIYRGYFAIGGLNAARSMEDRKAAADYREMYVAGRMQIDAGDPYYTDAVGSRIFPENVWPREAPEFPALWAEYYAAMEGFSTALIRLCALALDLPEHGLDRFFDKHMSTMAVTNYPAQEVPPEPGQLRCGAHTDYGALTLLMAENKPGGLEVMSKDGEWIAVPIVPDTFVINLGDLMQRWTNDRWLSNLHRVVNPPVDQARDSRRQSIIYFLHPNYDARIECIPSCVGEEGARHAPITPREHLLSKLASMKGAEPSKASAD